MLKLSLAQFNPTVGDFENNTLAIIQKMLAASVAGADMVVFSELSVCGYTAGDYFLEPEFLQLADAALDEILTASKDVPALTTVIGTIRRNTGAGKPLYNALLAIQDGNIVAEYYKQLLPTYNVFDERRYFEPGPHAACVAKIAGHDVGFMICEDGWRTESDRDYDADPLEYLARAKPELVVSINASPSNVGKREQRHELFTENSRRHGLPIVYVNQVGGHDQLVFDGASFAVSPSQGVAFEAPSFVDDFTLIGFEGGEFLTDLKQAEAEAYNAIRKAQGAPRAPLSNSEFYRQQIVLGIRDYARRCGFKTAVVGSSGGIDSALTLALAVEALGAENVFAITMPSVYSSEGSVSDSVALCRNLGIKLYTHPIKSLVESYSDGFGIAFEPATLVGLSLENLQARIRGTILMEFSNTFGALLLTTGNKSEISVGYCTLYGDTSGGLGPIGDLYKSEVFDLCEHINATAGREIIPVSIIVKPPSAELAPGQQDTDSLPPYKGVLDEILKWHIEGSRLSPAEHAVASAQVQLMRSTPEANAVVKRVLGMVGRNEYKRKQAPPIIRVRARAFGSGRQMPIAAKYCFA